MRCAKIATASSLALLLLPAWGSVVRADDGDNQVHGEIVPVFRWFADEETPNSAKFEQYREVPNGLAADRLRLDWDSGDRFYLDLDAFDISEDDQQIEFKMGGRDLWKFSVDWSENHRLFSDSGLQLHTHQGDGVFTVDDSLQAAIQAAPSGGGCDSLTPGCKQYLFKHAIFDNGNEVDPRYQRDTGSATIEVTPTKEFTLGLTAARERLEGTFPQVGTFYPFTNQLGSSEFAAPLDSHTDDLTLYAEYAAEKFNIGARYVFSDYETQYDTLTWDNPLFLTDVSTGAESANPAHGRLDLGNDSEMRKWTMFAAVNLPAHTRISATASQGRTEQNDPFLPTTINSLLVTEPLPAGSLDGRYDTDMYDFRVTSRPNRHVRWDAWWHRYKYDNKTPSLVFADYVITDYELPECSNPNACDANGNGIADDIIQRRNLPYGYEKTNYGASLDFDLVQEFSLGVGYERVNWDRQHTAVANTDDDVASVHADWDVTDKLFLRAGYRHKSRNADQYNAEYNEEAFPVGEAFIAAANEGERKFIWTDRDRDEVSLLVNVMPSPRFSLYAEVIHSKSDYSDPNTGQDIGTHYTTLEDRDFDGTPESYNILLAGRSDDKTNSYTLGFDVHPSDLFSLWADYSWESYEWTMWSRNRGASTFGAGTVGQDDPSQDWLSTNKDRYRTATLGFRGKFPKSPWDVTGSFVYERGKGSFDQRWADPSMTFSTPLPPDIENKLYIAQIAFNYYARSNLSFGFGYWYERWKEDDWQSDFNEPYMGDPDQDGGGAASQFSNWLGTDYLDYENHILSFSVRYLF